jgi:dTDP-4-dehydrorhamnose 3,5-epimerase
MEYKQQPSLTPEKQVNLVNIEGVKLRRTNVLGDDRGTIQEVIDVRDEYWNEGFVYLYKGTCRPGKFKGWGVHDAHDDRYIIVDGEMLLVLFDDREKSSTRGTVQEFYLSSTGVFQITIPAGVWHLHQNIGERDLIFLNSPTKPYDHANPDKRRLPVINEKIPYTLRPKIGW